jgi:hypothetical protein
MKTGGCAHARGQATDFGLYMQALLGGVDLPAPVPFGCPQGRGAGFVRGCCCAGSLNRGFQAGSLQLNSRCLEFVRGRFAARQARLWTGQAGLPDRE